MSYPSGTHHAPETGRSQRPGLDRPSLFAGMDDEPATEDHQRVRILSTLESTRHAARASTPQGGRRPRQSHRRSWLQGALWGAMGVGVLALLAGFAMVIQDNRLAMAQVPVAPTSVALARPQDKRPPATEITPPTAAGPAVIETTHADAPLTALSAATMAPKASSATSPAPAAERVATGKPSSATPAVKTPMGTAPPAQPGQGGHHAKGQDEDVALLEAMFAHTGRKPPPRPAAPPN